ncbi:MAG: hypothetical protein WDA22_07110 [Bacteroidota bacterium]
MLRFIIWMIVIFIVGKIVGQMIRYIRLLMTPNRDVLNRKMDPSYHGKKNIEDIPYEEIKEKQ